MSKMKGLVTRLRQESVWISLLSIVIGLVIGAIVMLVSGYDPLLAYQSLVEKIVGNSYDFGETLRAVVPLIMTGLAVAVAFRAGLFNIGVEGQIVMGSIGALLVGHFVSLPPVIHGIVAMIVGTLVGGLWGMLVAWLKTSRGINEVISCIMLNWCALYISHIVIRTLMEESGTGRSKLIQESASIQLDSLSAWMDGARIHWGFAIAIIAVIGYSFFMNKTKWGYEIRAVGSNRHAAHYAGMKVNSTVLRAFFISGMLGGMVGTFEVLGVFKYVAIAPATSGLGFDGIAVALLGMNTAIGIFFSAILFGALMYGAQGMSFGADVPGEVVRMIISIIIFFTAAPGLLRMFFKLRTRKGRKGANANGNDSVSS
ncbi:ABC transporter permease [Paenibacillus sp. ACRRX]|uniref:ABC transporter permease n=1 Tax=unclassified Paenibacillus TaxID=185978 RepID=UPI001EF5B948|nr:MULTISPECIES: ABC transporter permease [unclassified Paenibacillus]MCG7406214.1 ABC transporter permease [Paenibacillus sp. ACRRX]MDK8179247.1 ABC transporter permease [Paenibacillus sp. UMB4589-SE434]